MLDALIARSSRTSSPTLPASAWCREITTAGAVPEKAVKGAASIVLLVIVVAFTVINLRAFRTDD